MVGSLLADGLFLDLGGDDESGQGPGAHGVLSRLWRAPPDARCQQRGLRALREIPAEMVAEAPPCRG